MKSTAGHFIAFYAMRKLDENALGEIAVRFDELRTTRSESAYEPTEDETERRHQLKNACQILERGLPVVRDWIVQTRPGTQPILHPIPK